MIVRKAKISDIEKLIPVFMDYEKASINYLPKKYKSMRNKKTPLKTNIKKSFISNFRKKNSLFLVAEDDNKILGYIFGEIRDDSHPLFNYPKSGELNDIAVLKKYRNKSISTKLWNKLLNWFKYNNCEIVTLSVNFYNFKSQQVYKHWGFDPFYYRMIKKL
jgi:ribosomal protein S18 acetylase RimI-like enzyme